MPILEEDVKIYTKRVFFGTLGTKVSLTSSSMSELAANICPQLAALQQHSDGSELDEQLREHFEAVWQHPDGSPQQKKAISRLISKVQTLPGILKSNHQDAPIALTQTWLWFSSKVKEFNPGSPSIGKSLVRWINGYLAWRLKDVSKEEGNGEISLDESLNVGGAEGLERRDFVVDSPNGPYLEIGKEGAKYNNLSFTLLDKHITEFKREQTKQLALDIENYIKKDPQGKLRNCHPNKHPACNMQYLAQKFCLEEPPADKAEVAREIGVNYNTLYAHWTRNFYLLATIGLELGYQPEPLKEYIEQDPDGKLSKCHLKDKLECNAQFLAQKLLQVCSKSPAEFKPPEFKQLAQELYAEQLKQVPEQRQSNELEKWAEMVQRHWDRRCLPLITEIALQQKYNPPRDLSLQAEIALEKKYQQSENHE